MKRREFSAVPRRRRPRRHRRAGAPAPRRQWPVEGTNYVRLAQPVPVAAPAGKIEVIEFFWYGCPHCNAFEPTLDAWLKTLPPDVALPPRAGRLQRRAVRRPPADLLRARQRSAWSNACTARCSTRSTATACA